MRKILVALSVVLALAGAAPPALAETGSQRFTIVFVGTTGPVFASGVINGSGTIENVIPEVLDPEAGTFFETDRMTFPDGTLDVFFEGTVTNLFPDPNTCVARPQGTGTYEIVGGTGAYEGASGSGTITFPAILVFPRTAEGCGEAPTLAIAYVTAVGTLTI